MNTIVGKLDNIEIKEGMSKTGQSYTRYTFIVNGKRYSTFDKKLIEGYKSGDLLQLDTENDGQYTNVKNVKKIDALPKNVAQAQEFHLSNEECRARSLEIAIDFFRLNEKHPTFDELKEGANYIYDIISN